MPNALRVASRKSRGSHLAGTAQRGAAAVCRRAMERLKQLVGTLRVCAEIPSGSGKGVEVAGSRLESTLKAGFVELAVEDLKDGGEVVAHGGYLIPQAAHERLLVG